MTFPVPVVRHTSASPWHRWRALALSAAVVVVFGPVSTLDARQAEPAAPGASAEQPAAPVVHEAAPPGAEAGSAGQGAAEHEGAAEHGAEAEHEESPTAFLARLANFLILAGGLYYVLKSPIKRYLDDRGQQIRGDLSQAAQLRAAASRQMTEIDARLKALPAEIDALKLRGKEEIVAEQARIKQAAEAERQRLVEQTRREIDRQLQIARRDLTQHAADLAVSVARERLTRELGPEEQLRLVDRYAAQVAGGPRE